MMELEMNMIIVLDLKLNLDPMKIQTQNIL